MAVLAVGLLSADRDLLQASFASCQLRKGMSETDVGQLLGPTEWGFVFLGRGKFQDYPDRHLRLYFERTGELIEARLLRVEIRRHETYHVASTRLSLR